jgi:CubicO group peptidase (beta-lactamase class C family)
MNPMNPLQTWQIVDNFRPDLFSPQNLLERMGYYHTPGVSMAVINACQLEWAEAFGVADAGLKTPLTTDTLFQAASISKPVTAVATLKLVEQGRLELDADLRQYLRSWQMPWQEKITLRQVLSHTAGLNVHGYEGYNHSTSLPSLLQIVKGEAPANSEALQLEQAPATAMKYSGGGYTLLQMLLEDVCQQPFAVLMQTLLLEPIGMSRSSFFAPRDEVFATGHPEKGLPINGKYHRYPEMAAAGLWTTPSDLAQFGLALMQHTYLEPATIAAMLSPQAPETSASAGYIGLGFVCSTSPAGLVFEHAGWNEGFVAQMQFCTESQRGAVVMLNSNSGFPMLGEAIAAIERAY